MKTDEHQKSGESEVTLNCKYKQSWSTLHRISPE